MIARAAQAKGVHALNADTFAAASKAKLDELLAADRVQKAAQDAKAMTEIRLASPVRIEDVEGNGEEVTSPPADA